MMQPGSFGEVLTPDEMDTLRSRGGRRLFPRGTILFHEGDRSSRVILILTGTVKVSMTSPEGHETVLALRGPGDLVGELSAMDGDARSASVVTLGSVEAHTMTTEDFRSVLADHPRLSLLLLEMLAKRLRDADRKRMEFGAFDTIGRVASRLVEMADRFGTPQPDILRVALPLSQEELAGWVGSSRESVSKALRWMRDQGWISTGRKTVTILDLEALRERATD